MKSLIILSLLVVSTACSNKKDNPPVATTPAPVTQEEAPATETPEEVVTQDPDDSMLDPTPVVDDRYVDPYTSVLIQEIKNQLVNDPTTHEKRIQNVEFANRIYKVNFSHGPQSHLSLVTHTEKAFGFEHSSTRGPTQYFTAYSSKKDLGSSKNRVAVYTAEAIETSGSTKDKKVIIIKIKDVETGAMVHVFYIVKKGTLKVSYSDKNYDYTKELTKTSHIFRERLLEKPQVVGEFYGVITEERNISNASRFILTVSDNFTLESLPVTGHYTPDQPNSIPLMVDYKSFWKMFFFGSTAYKVGSDFTYVIQSQRKPVELTALNIKLKVEANERVEGQKNTVGLDLFIQFK